MYQLIQAQTRLRGSFNDWEITDVGDTRLLTLFQKFSHCLFYLFDPQNNVNGWVDAYQLPVAVRDSILTVNQYFTNAVGLSLVEDNPFPERGDNYLRFMNAAAYRFTFRGTNANFSVDENLLPDQRVDLLVAREGITDYSTLVSKTLMTVNGLCFRSWPIDGVGISLNHAGKFASKFNDLRVGILDFSSLGDVTTKPITGDMIRGGGTESPLYQGFFIDTGVSLTGKTVGLVIAGRLHLLDDIVNVSGEQRIRVNMPNVNLINHFYETYQYLDLDSIPLSKDANDVDQTVANEFKTDPVITAFFTLPYSFLVFIDSTNLVRETVALKQTHIEGTFLTAGSEHPDLPVQVGNGYLAEYNVFEQDGFWALRFSHTALQSWWYETIPMSDRQLVQSTRYGYRPTTPADARFLLIKKVADV